VSLSNRVWSRNFNNETIRVWLLHPRIKDGMEVILLCFTADGVQNDNIWIEEEESPEDAENCMMISTISALQEIVFSPSNQRR
jgi:hypothetical protein